MAACCEKPRLQVQGEQGPMGAPMGAMRLGGFHLGPTHACELTEMRSFCQL